MFRGEPLGDPGPEAIIALARRLIETPEHSTGNRWIPAGYTYLGQFIDHDITFDPTSKLDRDNDPEALQNFRTPRFDLDSVYGTGPLDQPFLYDWDPDPPVRGVKLLVGRSAKHGKAVDDLPRNVQDRALIGDPRNDENIILSQLHLLFLHFHNNVVDHVLANNPDRAPDRGDVFDEAQRIVRWHYQWIIVHDFLPRIVGRETLESVLSAGADGAPKVERRFYKWEKSGDRPFIPVEFSVGAYRFGHSMVRDNYVLGDLSDAVSIFGPDRQSASDIRGAPDLRGRRKLPPDLEIKWEHFFDTKRAQPVNQSMRIDPFLAAPLRRVPPTGRPLALLNLRRGVALELPAARDVATTMGLDPLGDDQLLGPLRGIDATTKAALLHATPLWYYVLCEASSAAGLNGLRLGPLGGRIVAEVLLGLLDADASSYLHAHSTWRPELPRATDADFTMPDLVRFAQGDV